jgi:hypothetical protein
MTIERIFARQPPNAGNDLRTKLSPRARLVRQFSTVRSHIAHKLNIRSEVPAPKTIPKHQQELQQDFFHALSAENLDVFDTFQKLANLAERLTGYKANRSALSASQSQLSDNQLTRLAENFKLFGRLQPALQEVINEIRNDGNLTKSEIKYLELLKTINDNMTATREMIEALSAEKDIAIDIKVDESPGDDQAILKRSLLNTWDGIKEKSTSPASQPLKSELDHARSEMLRRTTSARARRLREDDASIQDLWNTFKRTGNIDETTLKRLLTDALRGRGYNGLVNRDRAAYEIVNALTSRVRTSEQAQLLLPLLKAMHGRLKGTEGHEAELDKAIDAIKPKARRDSFATEEDSESEEELGAYIDFKEPTARVPKLESITDPNLLRYEIHDMAQAISHGSPGMSDDGFRHRAREMLLGKGINHETARLVLERAENINLGGRSRMVRDVLAALIEENASAAPSQLTDNEIYTAHLRKAFYEFADRLYQGEEPDIEAEIKADLMHRPPEVLYSIYRFLDRNNWLAGYIAADETFPPAVALFLTVAEQLDLKTRGILKERYGRDLWIKYSKGYNPEQEEASCRARFEDLKEDLKKEHPDCTIFDVVDEYFARYGNGNDSGTDQLLTTLSKSNFL